MNSLEVLHRGGSRAVRQHNPVQCTAVRRTVLPVTDPVAKVARRRICSARRAFCISAGQRQRPGFCLRIPNSRRNSGDRMPGVRIGIIFTEHTFLSGSLRQHMPRRRAKFPENAAPTPGMIPRMRRIGFSCALRGVAPESACSLPTAPRTHPGTGTGGWRAERPGSVRRWHVGTNDRRPTEDVRPRLRRSAAGAAIPAGGCGVRQRLPGASDAGCGGFPALAPPCPPSDAPEYRCG